MWTYRGQRRPEFAETPGPGQESVWDYPRPPAIVPCGKLVEVKHGKELIARSNHCVRVLETASPPTYYIPHHDIHMDQLVMATGSSFCEWKGAARYWSLADAPGELPVGWSYPEPKPAFKTIKDWLCFYPDRVSCFVDGERVRPQASGFYGGWITDDVAGPFKGDPGTMGW